jgi:predicted transport protein
MNAKQQIAAIKYSDANELFEQAQAAVKQCDYIIHRLNSAKYIANKEGKKADVRLIEKEIKAYEAKLQKLKADAIASAHEVMRNAAIVTEFGHYLNETIIEKAQALIDGVK